MFKRTFLLNDEDKRKVSEMCGKMMLWILEGQNIGYMSEKLDLPPWQIEANMDEMLYTLRKQVGIRRFLRTLFYK